MVKCWLIRLCLTLSNVHEPGPEVSVSRQARRQTRGVRKGEGRDGRGRKDGVFWFARRGRDQENGHC